MSRGFDKLPFYDQLVLFFPFIEGTGTVIQDLSDQHIVGDASAAPPVWTQLVSGQGVMNFVPTDYIIIPASYTILNFITEDFSLGFWVNIDTFTDHREFFCRGAGSADGYATLSQSTGRFDFNTSQAGVNQTTYSATGALVAGTWYCLGISRSGASARLYRNGLDITSVAVTHINPKTCARSAKIGILDDLVQYPLDGKMGLLKAWRNKALTQQEHLAVFEYEKKWFGF